MTATCPSCSGDSDVIDSRKRANGVIRRRRKCCTCGKRWSTIEIVYQADLTQIEEKIDQMMKDAHSVRNVLKAFKRMGI